MLPTTQHADAADGGIHDRKIRAIPFAENGALDMRGLELAARLHDAAAIVEQCLRNIQAAARPLAESHSRPNAEIPGGLRQSTELGRIHGQRIIVVALHVLHTRRRRIQPDPPRVTGNPRFGKGNQGGALLSGLFHEIDGFIDRAIEGQGTPERLEQPPHATSDEFLLGKRFPIV